MTWKAIQYNKRCQEIVLNPVLFPCKLEENLILSSVFRKNKGKSVKISEICSAL